MKIRSIFIKIMLPMIIIVCLLAIAILSITGKLFSNAYETNIKKQNDDSNKFIARSVESFMNEAYAVTEELAYSNEILSMKSEKQTPIVVGTASRNDYFELVYIQDMNGDQTARSSGELGNRANRWWFTQMLESGKPFVSKSYYSVNTNMACASIFFPLIKNEEMIGIFATDIKLTTLQALVEESSDMESGKISYIIDGEGTVLAHPENIYYEELYNYKNLTRTITQKDSSGKTLYDKEGNILTEDLKIEVSADYSDMISAVMAGETGSTEVTDKGMAYYASYAPVKMDGDSDSWSVVTLQDKSKAMSLIDEVNRTGLYITIAAILLSLILIVRVAHTIIRPIKLSHRRLKMLSEGDLSSVVPNAKGHDEGAQLLNNLNSTIAILRDIIQEINKAVQYFAEGDFRQGISSDFQGDFNILASSLTKIARSITKTLGDINSYANEFLNGISRFNEAAQTLADGTTSQASAVEELSSTLASITERVTQNAETSQNADQMMTAVRKQLQKSNSDMQELVISMKAIEENSEEISSINKLMQDIASKTNLLAMNASVEAARAGAAGKSFSVIASEIRTLAEQCSGAAKDISDLIDRTQKNVQSGMMSLNVTTSSIRTVSDGNHKTSRLISDISNATAEQADAINQISTALTQISGITQENSATASESARTSVSMKKQAEQLKELLNSYRY